MNYFKSIFALLASATLANAAVIPKVTTQREWDLATQGACGSGDIEALRALFAMESFHPRDSVFIEVAPAVPGLYPKCAGLIHWANTNGHSNVAYSLYGAQKCQDNRIPVYQPRRY
jgi:hypothetical protein